MAGERQRLDARNAKSRHWIVLIASMVVVNGCSRIDNETKRSFETNAVTLEMVAAGEFLKEIKDQGRLPGMSKDDHGKIKSDQMPLADSQDIFPFSQTFHLTKNGSSSTYHYSVLRPAKDGAW